MVFDLPFNMAGAHQSTSSPGSFVIDSIRYKEERLAGLKSQLSLEDTTMSFSENIFSQAANILQLYCSGKSSTAEPLMLAFHIPETDVSSAMLPSFFALPKGLQTEGFPGKKRNFRPPSTVIFSTLPNFSISSASAAPKAMAP